VESIILK